MMLRRLLDDVSAAGLPRGPLGAAPVGTPQLAGLPPAAQRYLHAMRVVGRPPVWSMLMGWTGRFRRSPEERWRRVRAWQYDTSVEIARLFHMRLRIAGLPVLARDTYVHGRGHMIGKALGLITVVDGKGPELDIGELVTWLNDAVLYAPSMLFGARAEWLPAEGGADDRFRVAITDRGTRVEALVILDGAGRPADFHTTDRFVENPHDPAHRLVRGHWSTPVDEWTEVDGRPVPGHGRASWLLPEGPFVYAELRLAQLCFDLPPGALPPRPARVPAARA